MGVSKWTQQSPSFLTRYSNANCCNQCYNKIKKIKNKDTDSFMYVLKTSHQLIKDLSLQMTKLGAVRINSMAERLKLSQQIREKTYLLFRQILVEKTYLFFNRHIDLIMLCCFYGVAKVRMGYFGK